jgi:hypothetical protein
MREIGDFSSAWAVVVTVRSRTNTGSEVPLPAQVAAAPSGGGGLAIPPCIAPPSTVSRVAMPTGLRLERQYSRDKQSIGANFIRRSIRRRSAASLAKEAENQWRRHLYPRPRGPISCRPQDASLGLMLDHRRPAFTEARPRILRFLRCRIPGHAWDTNRWPSSARSSP